MTFSWKIRDGCSTLARMLALIFSSSLRQAEAGLPIKELCRNGGFSDATFYKWRAKFGGMQVSEAQRLRELESENAKLKRLLAEAHLDMHALKSVLGVKR
jgi:putative transposase